MKWIPCWSYREQNYEPLLTQAPPFIQTITLPCNVEGNKLRILFSNQYGKETLYLQNVSIIYRKQNYMILFSNQSKLALHPKEEIYSDAFMIQVEHGQELQVLCEFLNPQTFTGYFGLHSDAMIQTSFQNMDGTLLDMKAYSKVLQKPFHPYVYFAIHSIEIACDKTSCVIGVCGDSLVHQGYWMNELYRLCCKQFPNVVVYNEGICGNRLLRDATSSSSLCPIFGDSLIHRYQKDMVERYQNDISILAVGINDLIHPGNGCPLVELCDVQSMIQGYQSILEMDQGKQCYVATLMPFYIYDGIWDAHRENIRQEVNHWIRSLPYVLDLDAWVRDEQNPKCLQPRFDGGDHLHINEDAGKWIAQHIIEIISDDWEGRES